MDCGVADARGVNGPWVAPEQLLIPRDRFRSLDLTTDLPSTSGTTSLPLSKSPSTSPPTRGTASSAR